MDGGPRILTGGVIAWPDKNIYILHITKKEVLLKVKEVPGAYFENRNGKVIAVVPMHEDTLTILRNQGLPSKGMEPLLFKYTVPLVEGAHMAMAHQVATAAFLSSHPRAYCTSTMRTGKTASVILGLDYLNRVKGDRGATLIVATVSNLTGVWLHGIKSTLPGARVVVVHGGTGAADRARKLKQNADYYIINYDGVKMVEEQLIDMVEQGIITKVVLDELTHYGNASSGRWKSMNRVVNGRPKDKHNRGRAVKYCWGLTGTPGNDPRPYFGMCRLVNPDKFPCRTMGAWQNMTMFKYANSTWAWKIKRGTAELLTQVMQPTIRYDKKDVMDLPPVVEQYRDCELTKEQEQALKTMRDDMYMIASSGELVEATQKSAMLHKLYQIALGTVIKNGETVQLDASKRMNGLLEVVKEAPNKKCVIFMSYVDAMDTTAEFLRKAGYTVGIVRGAVSGKRRDRIFHDFLHQKDPQILIAHPMTTAFGTELASASTMIFNGPPLSGGFVYGQALERLSSLRQKQNGVDQIQIIKFSGCKEEAAMFKGLDSGKETNALINDIFASITKAA